MYVNKELYDDKGLFESAFHLPNIDGNFTEQLEWALMYLSYKDSMRFIDDKTRLFNLKVFDGAWLMNGVKLGSEVNDMVLLESTFSKENQEWQATPEMFPDLNIKCFWLKERDDSANGLLQWKLIPMKERRHLQNIKYLLQYRRGFLTEKEKWYLDESYFSLEPQIPGKLQFLHKYFKYAPKPISWNPNYYYETEKWYAGHASEGGDDTPTRALIDLIQRINTAFQLKLTSYYEWFVYLREDDNSIGFKIPINPESYKDVFALRELPTGQERRKAICHFVKEHVRKVRTTLPDQEIESIVKKHIRGETKFNWRGLQVNVIPSEYDIKKVNSRNKRYLTV
jgi:hypothetical protein